MAKPPRREKKRRIVRNGREPNIGRNTDLTPTNNFNSNVSPFLNSPAQPSLDLGTCDHAGLNFYDETVSSNLTRKEQLAINTEVRKTLNDIPEIEFSEVTYTIMSINEMRDLATVNGNLISITQVAKNRNATKDTLKGTIHDPRMGSVSSGNCGVCNRDDGGCAGHMGLIEFNTEYGIIHPLFGRIVSQVLNSVCNNGHLILSEETLQNADIPPITDHRNRLSAIADISERSRRCCHSEPEQPNDPNLQLEGIAMGEIVSAPCVPNPKYTFNKKNGEILAQEKTNDPKIPLLTKDVFEILNRISDEDARLLGFGEGVHPRDFLLKGLLVLPPCQRRLAYVNGAVKGDPLEKLYNTIIRENQELKQTNKTEDDRRAHIKKIYDTTAAFYERTAEGEHGRSILDVISGKKGLIRQNMLGKRVNQTARTVLGPAPDIRFGQVAIPRRIASELTLPVKVNSTNYNEVMGWLNAGKINRLDSFDPRTKQYRRDIRITEKLKSFKIKQGDVVHRQMMNGDYVLFGRQPTLHKQGLMGGQVVIWSDDTLGLHPAVLTALNADFDGDEGTVHFPQTVEAQAETASIANVTRCIMNAQVNAPIIGLIQDSVAGAYAMTKENPVLTEDQFTYYIGLMVKQPNMTSLRQRLVKNKIIPDEIEKEMVTVKRDPGDSSIPYENWPTESIERVKPFQKTGRILFSALLPENFYYRRNGILIRDGILISGNVTKKNIGVSGGTIQQSLFKNYEDPMIVENFITDLNRVTIQYATRRGLTMSYSDCIPPDEQKVKAVIETERKRVEGIIEEYKDFRTITDPIERELAEREITGVINKARNVLTKRVADLYDENVNGVMLMANSGARGNIGNTAQSTVSLGGQYPGGKMVEAQISDGRRITPFERDYDTDPASVVYVKESLRDGMEIRSMFAHAQETRINIVIKVQGTQDPGKLQRQLMKAQADIILDEYGSGINTVNGPIVEPAYGFDPGHLVNQKFEGEETIPFFANFEEIAEQINSDFISTM
jgi:DNA-directed RNA polymerase beta' subunit